MFKQESEAKCNKCDKVYPIFKDSIMDNFSDNLGSCPECGSLDVRQVFGLTYDVSEGHYGNAANGYSKNVASHVSKFGKFKGKRVK